MRFRLIVGVMLLTFLFPMATASNGTSTAVDDNQQNGVGWLFDWVGQARASDTLLGAILVAIVTAILTALIKEIYKVREQYLIPYSKWCISFSGAIHEFQELCHYTIKPLHETWSQRSAFMTSIDIITHVWHMHGQVEEGFKWLSMFKKHNGENLGEALDNVMDEVDTLWHKLEVYDENLLRKRRDAAELSQIMKGMLFIERTSLVDLVVRAIGPQLEDKVVDPQHEVKGKLTEKRFGDVIAALNKRIPRKYL